MIDFLCPNGHRIRCQAEQVGRAAKCPRCGVKFRVPEPADQGGTEAATSDSKVSRPEFTDSGIAALKVSAPGEGVQPGGQIEFLCPNGHRLHGPASLQGKPGQCPDCGSRFRIPTYEDIPGEEEAASQISLGRVDGREGSDVGVPAAAEASPPSPSPTGGAVPHEDGAISQKDGAISHENGVVPHEDGAMPTTISSRCVAGQDMYAFFARLWEIRPKDAAIKLFLRGGETIIPHDFLKKVSEQSRQGVFTTKEADGTISLTAVAWEGVIRVTVRGLKEVPKELAG